MRLQKTVVVETVDFASAEFATHHRHRTRGPASLRFAVAGFVLSRGRERSLVPEAGIEPGRPYGQGILSLCKY
jgi:hypothetical protein